MADGSLVLVTGGTGYIATYVVKELLQRGFRVRVTVRDPSSKKCDILKSGCEVEGQAGKVELMVADLLSDEGWAEAAAGCEYVIHTASPVGKAFNQSKKQDAEQIEAAKQGAVRALSAAAASGTCKRVVLTSSIAAIQPPGIGVLDGRMMTEEDYADGDPKTVKDLKMNPYQLSKITAERAAWDLCKEKSLEMATVHPSYTIGPSMSAVNRSESLDAIDLAFLRRELKGKVKQKQDPVMDVPIPYVDVRDVAKIHVEAMLQPEAKDRRYIAHAKTELMPKLLGYLSADYPTVNTKPDGSVKCFADCCNSCCCCCLFGQTKMGVTWLRKTWGKDAETLDNSRSIKELRISYMPIEQTIKDHAESWHKHNIEFAPWVKPKSGQVAPEQMQMNS
eukprot:gnl/MRDRNA2_/MRDRNA2_160624_c0_seq1.p1 gnl/MRDRNA2_/MRDRNA2_160624_c0~~gnl/MRDRNA2_/MRDRNA2_160624_c0_seq1.p1  ORF type:complete len:424 (+),score=77.14 gnl/MRDRNA2_/MRDRNA2_160624_c0_seq1:100-1272(+)